MAYGDNISRQAAIDDIRTMNPKDAQLDIKWVEMWLKQLPPAQPEQYLDEWCIDCKEYDKEKHSCPRWNRVIRQTLVDAQPEPCEDAVSRKAVIDTIDEWNEACADSGHKETVSDIMLIRKDFIDLPPVTPEQFERIRGRWVKGYDGRHAVCSNCEAWWIPFGEGYKADYHFCPNCGAKMEGVAE